jgi:hypothetical protein
MSTRDMSALRAVRVGKHDKHVGLLEGRGGTGDESTGSDFAGLGQEDHLVAQAAEIIGISDRHMRRWRERHEKLGQDGLVERRRGKPSPIFRNCSALRRSIELFRAGRSSSSMT